MGKGVWKREFRTFKTRTGCGGRGTEKVCRLSALLPGAGTGKKRYDQLENLGGIL